MFSRIRSLFGTAVLFALVLGVTSAERSFAQTNVEILATDLADDPAGDDAKKAYEKVNKKIEDATLTGGSMVTFPSGEFKDVGEILITGVSGTAAVTGTGAKPANPVTFRGNNTVFTGKIMFNVQNSQDIVIEGFTFRDTQVPDLFTNAYQDVGPGSGEGTPADHTGSGGANARGSVLTAPHSRLDEYEYTGIIFLNTQLLVPRPSPNPDNLAHGPCPAGGPVRNVAIRNNVIENTHTHGIYARFGKILKGGGKPYANCNFASNIEISGNTLTNIGLGPNAVYLDAAKTETGHYNWDTAIQSHQAYDWTVRGNTIDGTTWIGIKIDNAFGKTVIESNTVRNTAASGIVVGGNGSTGDNAADDAEITIKNNTVTDSRNDPYFVQQWAESNYGDGYAKGQGRPGAASITTHTQGGGPQLTEKRADELLETKLVKRPSGFTKPYIGSSWRPISTIVRYSTNTSSSGKRIKGNGIVANTAVGQENSGDVAPPDTPGSTGGSSYNIPEAAVVKHFKPSIEAGIELNRLTAKSIVVENNELTDNVVGLLVCPSWYCYADEIDGVFKSALPANWEVAAGNFKVPTLTANRIYNNRKQTDMPRVFVVADVVNALSEADTGTESNVLVLAGNYLGAGYEVRGAANFDDLAEEADTGPRETVPPALPSTGGAMFTGTTVTLMYGEALDEDSVPAAAAFTVTQATSSGLSGSITVSSVAVAGMSVTLTLAEAPGSGNSVTVSYDPTKAGGNPIRDANGNAAAAIDSRMVAAAAPMEPEEPMTEEPMTGGGAAATGGDGGCALASGGKGGIDLGVLLPLMTLAALSFGLRRGYKESVEIR